MAQREEKKTAVALEYEAGDRAPKVVATGQGVLAEKIIDVAKEANVPVHKDEKLARSLSILDIGEYSPGALLHCGRDSCICGRNGPDPEQTAA